MTSARSSTGSKPSGAGFPGNALALLGREAGRMPMVAVSLGLRAWESSRFARQFALRRANEVLQIAGHTPIGRFLPQPVLEDGDIDNEARRIASDARDGVRTGAGAAVAPTPIRRATPGPVRAARPAAPAAPATPPAAAVAAGAPGAVTDQVDKVADRLNIDEPTSRNELPIADFDNVSLGSLRARLRSLSLEQLVTLREWEQGHANRLPVVTLLDNRIAKVSAEQSAADGPYPAEGESAVTTSS